jgi:uncharacterized membrane protein
MARRALMKPAARERRRRLRVGAIPPQPQRIVAIDVLRGVAIVAMIVYHFSFDLRMFGITQSDFEHDWRWIAARSAILGTFLLVAGVSLLLADRAGTTRADFWRRVGMIVGCALIVSGASYVMFPRTFIWFGVLHAIAVSLVLAQPLVRRPRVALVVGIAVVAAGLAFSHPAFDNRYLGWIGFMTERPPTEDYVPLFPWSGLVLIGIALADLLDRRAFAALAPLARAPRALVWLGRHSLLVYMVHQPILIGALWLATRR